MAVTIDQRVDQLIALLPRGLAEEVDAERFLRGVLTPLARVEAYLDLKTQRLPTLLDAETVPDELVPFLAAIVGIGDDLSASFALTVDERRRLIPLAVNLWKRKGTRRTWRDVVLFLAARRVLILDWFHHRMIAGSALEHHLIPAPGTSPGGNYDVPEHVTDLWYMDPDDTAAVGTILRWLEVMRATSERINVYRALFVDDMLVETNLWAIDDPAKVGDGFDASLQSLVSTEGNMFRPDPAIVFEADSVNGQHMFVLLAINAKAELFAFLQPGGTIEGYSAEIDVSVFPPTITVNKYTAGVPAVLAVFVAPAIIVDGFVYRWTLDTFRVGGGDTEIRVRWEAVTIGSVTDAASPYTDGTLAFRGGPGAADRAIVGQVLQWRHGVTPDRVGLP